MTKDEFSNKTASGGLTHEARKQLLLCFEEKFTDGEEVNLEAFADICLSQLQLQTTLRIQGLNEMISKGIREFIIMRQWVNLSQVYRSLPTDIENASKDESGKMGEEVRDWCKRAKKFNGLSSDKQKAALAWVEEQDWKVRNRGSGTRP